MSTGTVSRYPAIHARHPSHPKAYPVGHSAVSRARGRRVADDPQCLGAYGSRHPVEGACSADHAGDAPHAVRRRFRLTGNRRHGDAGDPLPPQPHQEVRACGQFGGRSQRHCAPAGPRGLHRPALLHAQHRLHPVSRPAGPAHAVVHGLGSRPGVVREGQDPGMGERTSAPPASMKQ